MTEKVSRFFILGELFLKDMI